MREVIIIGSGPAGYTAAIYAARAGLSPLMIASSVEPGGELMKTTEVENYPGFPDGLMGPDLMDQFQKQAERFGTEILLQDVVEVDLKANPKIVKCGNGDVFEAKAVIWPPELLTASWDYPTRRPFRVTALAGARPAMASSLETRPLQLLAAATQPWRKPLS